MRLITQKELQARWKVKGLPLSLRTVIRRVRRMQLEPARTRSPHGWFENSFRLSDVKRAERKAGIVIENGKAVTA